MLEKIALTRWCPMVRLSVSEKNAPSRNRHPDQTLAGCLCIASDCMMWVETDNEAYPSNNKHNEGDSSVSYPAGYCGLMRS